MGVAQGESVNGTRMRPRDWVMGTFVLAGVTMVAVLNGGLPPVGQAAAAMLTAERATATAAGPACPLLGVKLEQWRWPGLAAGAMMRPGPFRCRSPRRAATVTAGRRTAGRRPHHPTSPERGG